MTTAPRAFFVLSFVLLMTPGLSFAQDQSFKSGMVAYDRKEWGNVIKFMNLAVKEEPKESPRKVEYGGLFGIRQRSTEYLPYYYLGEALYRLQEPDCIGAVENWAASEKQGVVQARADLMRNIQDGFVVCKTRGVLPPSEFDPQVARVQQQYTEVGVIAQSATTLGEQNPDLWKPDIRLGYERATAELEAARKLMATARTTRGAKELAEAGAAIDRARGVLTTINATLRTALDATRQTQAAARDAEQALNAADALRDQLDGRATGRQPAFTSAMTAARQRAQEALVRGRERYNTGLKSANQNMLVEARSLGQEASQRYRQLLDDVTRLQAVAAERQLADARTGAVQTLRFVDDLFVALDTRMAANPALAEQVTPQREAARQQAADVRRRVDTALRGDNVPAIVQATRAASELRDRLNELTARFGPLTLRERGVSEALESGAARFFAGRYEEALQQLNPAAGFAADDPLRLHVHLFRAAALHALYGQSRETRPELRAQALAEIEECRKIDSTFQPDPRAFSPRFIALYRDGSVAGVEPGPSVRQ